MNGLELIQLALRNLPVEVESDPAFKALKDNPELLIPETLDESAKLFLQFRGISTENNPQARLSEILRLLKDGMNGQIARLRQINTPEALVVVNKFARLLRHLPEAAELLEQNANLDF